MEYLMSPPRGPIALEPLTLEAFAEFGTVIENPNPHLDKNQTLPPNASIANQGTAVKYANISSVHDVYHRASSKTSSKPMMSMFACFPRQLRRSNGQYVTCPLELVRNLLSGHKNPTENLFLEIPVMERHPFTSQTFVPLGLDESSSATSYVVVVAPTQSSAIPHSEKLRKSFSSTENRTSIKSLGQLSSPTAPDGIGLPDLKNVRAFLAKGHQAVTYGAGIWHAPMAVIGLDHVDFVVFQNINGVPQDDCQEVWVGLRGTQNRLLVSLSNAVPAGDVQLSSNL